MTRCIVCKNSEHGRVLSKRERVSWNAVHAIQIGEALYLEGDRTVGIKIPMGTHGPGLDEERGPARSHSFPAVRKLGRQCVIATHRDLVGDRRWWILNVYKQCNFPYTVTCTT